MTNKDHISQNDFVQPEKKTLLCVLLHSMPLLNPSCNANLNQNTGRQTLQYSQLLTSMIKLHTCQVSLFRREAPSF